MKALDKLEKNEKRALIIFNEIKTLLYPSDVWEHLQENHKSFVKHLNRISIRKKEKEMLIDYRTVELQDEIDRRKEAEFRLSIPRQVDNPDFKPLQKTCQAYMEAVVKGESGEDDFIYNIFEKAIEIIYGENEEIWKLINSYS